MQRTDPDTVAAIQKVSASSDNITVNWTAPVSISVDSYQIRIESVDFTTRPMEQPRTLPKNITNTTFSNLEPGFAYTISIRTVTAQGQFGQVVRFRAVTKPLPVENLEISAINTTALRVKWSLNRSSKQNITQVTYGNTTRQVVVSNQSEFSMELTNLVPGEAYSVTVISIRANESDEERSLEMTRQGFTYPLPVRNLTLTYTRDTLLVTWGQPSGVFSGFQLLYRNVLREPQSNFMYREYSLATARSAMISNLFHGEKYQVVLTSVSHGLNSSEVAGDIVIDPLPPKDLTFDSSRTTTGNIRLQWSYNYEETYVEKWIVQVKEGLGLLVERGSDTFYSIDLDQLAAGQTYNVSVQSQVMNQVSREVSITVTTKPLMNSLLKEDSSTNSSITLSYTVMEADTFDQINFTLLNHQFVDFVVKEKTDRSRKVTFVSLAAGTKYTVQAVTVSKSETSSPVTIDIFTDPLPVPVQFTSTAKEVSMKLGPQIGTASAYAIYCLTLVNTGCGEKIVQASTDLPPVVFADLQSYHIYKFRVITMTGVLHVISKNVTMDYEYQTAEAPPGPVRMLTAKDKDLHSVELTWQPPAVANGEIKNYIISYYGEEPMDPEIKDAEKVVKVPTLSHTLTDLKAGFKYTFKVAAVTIEKGEDTQLELTMKTSAPVFKASLSAETSRPQPVTDKDKSLVSQNQIKLEIVNPFSTDNGYIRYYTVVVTMNKDSKDSSSPLPSWSEAKKDKTIKVYQAENCTDLFAPGSTCGTIASNTRGRRAASVLESRQFVLGADLEDDCVEKKYCNGPLTADTTYYVKLRGYTASGEYQETAYSEAIKTGMRI
ncbi:unnamed protein product [Lymnaea stagnalis]|uniref:protein-tyrosine-phosphatase n=1 Tax=Lymnaea stagnalis TaxID=6523 RepID=A0AAV2H6A5_LYMST